MLKGMNVPAFLWGEAVTTAVYLLNRCPTSSLDGMTPYEAWYKEKPDVSSLRVFGCVANVKITKPHLKKLEDRSKPMVFIGYVRCRMFKVYDPVGKRVHVTRDVVFDEGRCWDWSGVGHDDHDYNAQEFTVEYLVPCIGTSAVAMPGDDGAATPASLAHPAFPRTPAAPASPATFESPSSFDSVVSPSTPRPQRGGGG